MLKKIMLFAVAALLVTACSEKKMPAPKKQKPVPAPAFTLENLAGAKVSMKDFKGKPVIVNFWATWCASCLAEMQEMDTFYRAKKNTGLVMLMINLKESRKVVDNFIRENGYAFTVLLDDSGGTSELFQVFGLPSTYFIDKRGYIRDRWLGSVNKELLYSRFADISG